MVFFTANMYTFNLEGFIFSSVLLVVSIYMIIVGYKKGIKKDSAGNEYQILWQLLFFLGIMLLLLVLFLFYIHFSSFQFPFSFSPFFVSYI